IPPTPSSSAMLSLEHDTNNHSISLDARRQDHAYVAVSTVSAPSESTLTIAEDDANTTPLKTIQPPSLVTVQGTLERVSRLRIWIGNHCRPAWSTSSSTTALPRKGDVKIDVGVDGARFDILVYTRGTRRIRTGLS